MAPVVEAFRGRPDEAEARVVLTGQHSDLVDQVLDSFGMVPRHDLGIMREGQSHYDVAHGCLDGLRRVVAEEEPDAILVQGDTASVCFGALVGFFEKVAVGHVEAGLRSGDKWAPWPEEIFRRVTDVLSDWYFAPTTRAAANLRAEGVGAGSVHVSGNTVVDALLRVAGGAGPVQDPELRAALDGGRRLVLLTAHRRESFGEPLRDVLRGVREVADAHDDVEVVYPVHPNPNVRAAAAEILEGHPRIRLTSPVGYLDLVTALSRAALVLTDSGGIQEEAPTFGVPVLVLRDVTERPEGVEAGVAELVGTDRRRLVERASAILGGQGAARSASNPYGDGRAGERIADIVIADLTGAARRTKDWDG
ncbi:MAG: UDP-N-acetylglucosamine 2-epimerase (non-hydrolyzing) [Gemmatimonadetes bacterium]|nr:UDP-N-acetylglucosamine 2-epimerase (non-hydrolyzing) [Gemmatimonadota bacterium]